jgi:hypothetical protein
VNRWRGQVGLQPLRVDELSTHTRRIATKDGGSATLVDYLGWEGSGMPPVAGGRELPAGHPPVAAQEGLRFGSVPDHWRPGRTGQMRRAAFDIVAGDQKAEVTIIDLPASAGDIGDVLANVNRWRRQIGLAPLEAADQVEARDLAVNGKTGTYVELIGEPQAILAVMVPDGDRVWFIKMMGDRELVDSEKQGFRSFAESIRF